MNNNNNCEKMCCCIVEREIEINGEIILDIFGEDCGGDICNFEEIVINVIVDIGKDMDNIIIEYLSDLEEEEVGLCSKCGEEDIIGLNCCEIVCVECLEKYGDCINGVREYNDSYICSCEVELCMDTDTYEVRGDCEKCYSCEYYFESDYVEYNGDYYCCECLCEYEENDIDYVCEGCDRNGEVISDMGDILYYFRNGCVCNECM